MNATTRLILCLLILCAGLAAPVAAGEVEKSVPFELEKWTDLGVEDGPVTLHRIRMTKASGFTKSKLMRPGNSEYLEDVQIELEFSNSASRDWEARLRVEWRDADGRSIDGYNDTESLDDKSSYEDQTVRLSTLRYGLERAEQLTIRIEFYPD